MLRFRYMNKYAAAGLVIIFALIIGYGAFRMYTKSDPVIVENQENTVAVARSEKMTEDATDYSIDVEYAQFGVASIDADIRAAVDTAAQALKDQAAKDTPVSEGFRKYELFGSVERTHVGNEISATIILAQDFGGAHPLPIAMTFNYTKEGKKITLNDALAMTGKTLAQIAADAKVQLNAQLGTDVIAPEGADAKADNYSTFEIADDKVTFIFQPYQVAPYAAGMPKVTFSRI